MSIKESVINEILELHNQINQYTDLSDAIEKITNVAIKACNADAGFFFTINEDKFLNLEYTLNNSLHFGKKGSDNLASFPTVFLPEAKNKSAKSPMEQAIFNNEILNTPNLNEAKQLDLSFFHQYDEDNDYRTMSLLALPISNRKGNVIAVAVFLNAKDGDKNISFDTESQKAAQSVCNLAGLIIENRRLSDNYSQLLESFIEVLARAIDAKSPYTGSHCQRVPVIARLLATAAVQEDSGPLRNFEMSPDDWYCLHIASWLHDCGKVTTPEYIVDKATKLETIYNRIHEIRNRFEILRRDAHIEYLKNRLNNTDSQQNLQARFVAYVKKLEEDFDFVARCNIGDTPLKDEDIKRLEAISKQRFTRYFSRMKGISWAERDNIKDKELFSHPAQENLLQNRDDQIFGEYNRGELYNLEVKSGTITKEERRKINEHIEVTIDMLKALPFPKELSNVVEYAGAHHERIDGKGYPNGLTGDQMSVPAKIMAIADIFEALTANDRPYKEPKKLSEVLKIMQGMKNSGHIDPDLYEVFIRNKVYLDYAEQYVSPEQIDEVNPEDYL